MTSTTENEEVLVQDGRGRVRVSLERRDALLGEYDRSGMSAARFAQWAGMKYSTFAGWLQRRRKKALAGGTGSVVSQARPEVRWVEAVVNEGGLGPGKFECGVGAGKVLVHLPGGARMEIGDGAGALLAAEMLRVISRGTRGC